jgi:hypothetical protein
MSYHCDFCPKHAPSGSRTHPSAMARRRFADQLPARCPQKTMWTPGIEPGLRVLQTRALPFELSPQMYQTPPTGLEPVTFRVTSGRSCQLSYGGKSCSSLVKEPCSRRTCAALYFVKRRVEDSNLRDTLRRLRISSAASWASRTNPPHNQRRVRDSNSQGTCAPRLFSRQVPYQLG